MKKLSFLLVAIIVASCANEPKDYVTLSGEITDKSSDSVVVRTRTFSKTITVNQDGTFSDTLKVETGVYSFYDGNESTNIFLKNGYDINITLDTKMFDETIKYTGEGSESSTFLAQVSLMQENLFDAEKYIDLDSVGLNSKFIEIKEEIILVYNTNKDVDSTIINDGLQSLDRMLEYYKRVIGNELAMKRDLYEGATSPKFVDYMNFDGSKTSLEDLNGKYVYIDVWATWCGPCKREIPSLKKVEAAYHDKNIAFVSLSIDDEGRSGTMEKAEHDWRAMVADKELGGIQIMAPKGWKSQFVKDYKINGIPRFILIDPNGNIISADAPRPSSDSLIKLFDEHNI